MWNYQFHKETSIEFHLELSFYTTLKSVIFRHLRVKRNWHWLFNGLQNSITEELAIQFNVLCVSRLQLNQSLKLMHSKSILKIKIEKMRMNSNRIKLFADWLQSWSSKWCKLKCYKVFFQNSKNVYSQILLWN